MTDDFQMWFLNQHYRLEVLYRKELEFTVLFQHGESGKDSSIISSVFLLFHLTTYSGFKRILK